MKELNSSLIKAATREQNPCSSTAQAAVCSRRLPGQPCQERHHRCRPDRVLITGVVGPRAPTPAALLGVRRDALNRGLAHLATVFFYFRFAEETGCRTQWKPLGPSSPTPQLGPLPEKGQRTLLNTLCWLPFTLGTKLKPLHESCRCDRVGPPSPHPHLTPGTLAWPRPLHTRLFAPPPPGAPALLPGLEGSTLVLHPQLPC